MRSRCEAAVDLQVSVQTAGGELSEATLTTSAWLVVDRRQQGKGCGRFLLADALYRAAQSEIASFAVIVDAKDEGARRFYEQESFLPFLDQPMKLFRPMADIRRLLDEPCA
jgi:GNAT superfamily N-acetyltransferase